MLTRAIFLNVLSCCLFIGLSLGQVESFAQNIDETVETMDQSPEETELSPENEPPLPSIEDAETSPKTEKPDRPTLEMKTEQAPSKAGLVEVEPTYAVTSDVTGALMLVPYKMRRDRWGHAVAISYSQFNPSNYEPDGVTDTFDTVFGSAESPLLELTYSYKWNIMIGSLAAELGAGSYSNQSDDPDLDATLKLFPVRLAATLALDNIMYEPYLVPYLTGGTYSIFYKEERAAVSFNGTTQAAPFWAAGLLFQLNWVDKISARASYIESGVENTFLYLEGRQMLASSAAKDPDFSTGVHLDAGLKLEF